MSETASDLRARYRGCLLGLAAGDAVGTAVEFLPRGTFEPITDMVGGGPFDLAPGQWTDDTSLALCLATSLVESGGFDPADQLDRYLRWWETGYLSSTGVCFDIGNSTAAALDRYRETGDARSGSSHPRSAGNGSLMRLAPAVLFGSPDLAAARLLAVQSSLTTHAAEACLDACRLFAGLLLRALGGMEDKDELLLSEAETFEGLDELVRLARGGYFDQPEQAIRGTGYVVESLEAALWCFRHTDSYEAAVLRAANLGDDADTTAAICGQLAGAFYGEAGIPQRWRQQLALHDTIAGLAEALLPPVCARCDGAYCVRPALTATPAGRMAACPRCGAPLDLAAMLARVRAEPPRQILASRSLSEEAIEVPLDHALAFLAEYEDTCFPELDGPNAVGISAAGVQFLFDYRSQ